MKAVVFGAAGMLGKAVSEELAKRGNEVVSVTHQDCSINDAAKISEFIDRNCDVVFNCAGLHKAREIKPTDKEMLLTNGLGPQTLQHVVSEFGVRLVHVSTDCVFTGKEGPYTVDSIPDARDGYGLSKSIGEYIALFPNTAVVRTSFIGKEHGLLHWLLTESKAEVEGWTKAYWSGSTVYAVARGLVDIADSTASGIIHLTTQKPISKYQALLELSYAFGLSTKIKPVSKPRINRELIPTVILEPLNEAILELKERMK